MTSPERHRAQQLLRAKESREQRAALLLGEAQRALKDAEARLETLLRWKQDYSQQQTKLRQVRERVSLPRAAEGELSQRFSSARKGFGQGGKLWVKAQGSDL